MGFLFFTAPNTLSVVAQAPLRATLAIVYMAIFPGIIAYLCWSYALANVPAARAGSYLAIIPITATIIAWVWLGEIPSVIALVGGIVIVIGVLLVNRKESISPKSSSKIG